MTIKVDPDWWKNIFDDVYLMTDARSVMDDDITRREVDVVGELIPIKPEHNVLDLCGGHGRHSLELAARGFAKCVVFDYSERLLERGRERAADCGHKIDFVQGDARGAGFDGGSFDHVLIMGNSLGYIDEPDADRTILGQAHRVLRPGGWVLIDVADGAHVRSRFAKNAWHEIEPGVVVCRERELIDHCIHAREVVLGKEKGLIRDQTYSIRLYGPEDLAALVESAGFVEVKVHTDFSPQKEKGDYGFMNHRMIATGKKED